MHSFVCVHFVLLLCLYIIFVFIFLSRSLLFFFSFFLFALLCLYYFDKPQHGLFDLCFIRLHAVQHNFSHIQGTALNVLIFFDDISI